jgi:8-hydroxy-5-deazaflavin:NADPH oxidoreductase
MELTIIGTGNMGHAIATRALAGGHTVTLYSHQPGDAESLAQNLDVEAGAPIRTGQAGDPLHGDVVVLAIPYVAAEDVIGRYGEALAGKVVIDITNPVDLATFDRLVTPPDSSAAEEIQRMAGPDARVVKAFNTTFAGTLVNGNVGGQPLDVLIASDDQDAKDTVARLAADGGLRAIDVGPLRRARQLEHAGFLHMALQQSLGTGFGSALKFLG